MGKYIISLVVIAVIFARSEAAAADEQTRAAQQELRKRHLFYDNIDGEYSPGVGAALRRYQEIKGFTPTGLLDEDTLQSLGIFTVGPPAEGPQVVVALKHRHELRDQNGELMPGAQFELGVNPPRPVDQKQVQDYLHRYLVACETPQLQDDLSFFAGEVDYFDHGIVDRDYIEAEIAAYDQHWPHRHYTMTGPFRLTNRANESLARFRLRFELANDRSALSAAGLVEDTVLLRSSGDVDWEIAGIKEEPLAQAAPRRRAGLVRHKPPPKNNPVVMAFHSVDHVLRNLFSAAPSSKHGAAHNRL